LEVHEREQAGGQVFVVVDRVLGRYHQLGPAAYAVLEAIEEGTLSVWQLPAELARRHQAVLSLVEVGRILVDLERLELLEVTPERARQRGESPAHCAELARLRASDRTAFHTLQARLLRRWQPRPPLLQRARRLRVHLWDPERLLARLTPLGRVLLTGRTAMVAGVTALVALGIQLEHGARLRLEMGAMLGHPGLFLLTAAVVTFLHELGHGLACHVFGGRVRDVGAMLLYFCIPAAYCDVSDGHLIESRRQRAVVALAGCYVNVLLWAAATLAWRVLAPELWPSQVALAVIATTDLSLFLNLNPLLPLDGYYALEELVGIQNLRQRSRLYRVASALYIWVVVPLALGRLFRFLVERFRLVGFLAFCLCATIVLLPLAQRAWRWVMDDA
jgi:hypothetical protein